MFYRKLKYGIILFLLALCLVLAGIIYFSEKNDNLKVIFLDIGQGDAILVSKGSYQMLIDGGQNGKLLLEKLGKYIPFWDRKIEVMVATHPDQDHIAGLVGVLEKYKVESIIKTQDKGSSQTYKKFEEDITDEKANNIDAMKNTIIDFSDGALARVLYPFSETGDVSDNGSNSESVVIKINYGENSFLLAGDLPKDKELALINSGEDISSKFLKVSHHGSKYSTGMDFLEKVNPIDAIISVGKNNSYGHPNAEILDRLKEKISNILRTDEKGDIVYECRKDLVCRAN
ncbi:MAG: MBL fold metallo-hydrolase [Patescibacteria group bacterium]